MLRFFIVLLTLALGNAGNSTREGHRSDPRIKTHGRHNISQSPIGIKKNGSVPIRGLNRGGDRRQENASTIPAPHPLERIALPRISDAIKKSRGRCKLLLLGDSIVYYLRRNVSEWTSYSDKWGAINAGVPGDKTENLLFRLGTEQFQNLTSPSLVTTLIGTNNVGSGDTAEQTFAGVGLAMKLVQKQFQTSVLVLYSLLPRGAENLNKVIREINIKLQAEYGKSGSRVRFLDVYNRFLDGQGINQGLYEHDRLHLNNRGSTILLSALDEFLAEVPAHAPPPSPATATKKTKTAGNKTQTSTSSVPRAAKKISLAAPSTVPDPVDDPVDDSDPVHVNFNVNITGPVSYIPVTPQRSILGWLLGSILGLLLGKAQGP